MTRIFYFLSIPVFLAAACQQPKAPQNVVSPKKVIVQQVEPPEVVKSFPFSAAQQSILSKRESFARRFDQAKTDYKKLAIQKAWFTWLHEYLVIRNNGKVSCNALISFRDSVYQRIGNYPVFGEFNIGAGLRASQQENYGTLDDQHKSRFFKHLFSVNDTKPVTMAFRIKEVDRFLEDRIRKKLEDPLIRISLQSINNL